MKKSLPFLILFLIFWGCKSSVETSHYKIVGVVQDTTLEGEMAYILPTDRPNLDDMPIDSAKIVNGVFAMEGTAPLEPATATFIVMNRGEKVKKPLCSSSMLLEKGTMNIRIGENRSFFISGTVHNDMLMVVRRSIIEYVQKTAEINAMPVSRAEKIKLLNDEQRRCNQDIINSLMRDPEGEITKIMLKEIYIIFNSEEMAFLRDHMESTPDVNPKTRLSDLNMILGEKYKFYDTIPDVNGNLVCLNDVISSHDYTVVEFWSSFCTPCVNTNRGIAHQYAIHKGKRLAVVLISVDRNYDEWKNASAKYDDEWISLSNLKGWNCPVATKFNISHIPSTFLFNSERELIRGDFTIDELAIHLEED